ncbi:hypothetical protein HWV62_24492 [Athelia sp. TMB]|nr:hypothetical protein HWV62_24492 [Athelia sp. TMB]
MSRLSPTLAFGIVSLALVLIFYLSGADLPTSLSPQGCRMSWMSPSYVMQSGLDKSWSPLADRYSLWLYREVGWEGTPGSGVPVLFIPGNAGSSHQVRSIASSATRQFYESPYIVSQAFAGRGIKPLDFYSVDFNEDFSALHGPTLDSQISYSSRAISFILSQYLAGTEIIVMGHSMGGVVATALLSSGNISAVITMSTPHTLPPARLDSRISEIYARNQKILAADHTPILSLCGGATDMMIPSESCILPSTSRNSTEQLFRRTVFTSALEGSWTGVGHREMVWCHQVRWRVARAALELGGSSSAETRAETLDTWLRDGNHLPHSLPSRDGLLLDDPTSFDILPIGHSLAIKSPRSTHAYLFPVPDGSSKFVVYVEKGAILPVAPQNSGSLRVSVYGCSRPSGSNLPPTCNSVSPAALKLIPNPTPGKPFPVPDEGFDESEGVVAFEADIQPSSSYDVWASVHIESAGKTGWIAGGFVADNVIVHDASALAPFIRIVTVDIPASRLNAGLWSQIHLPAMLSNALVVYRVAPILKSSSPACANELLPPLLMHTTKPSETHYYPLMRSPPQILLHSHSSAPCITGTRFTQTRGLDLTIYSSASSSCISGLSITVDWWATVGRWGTRYMQTAFSWSVGVVALILLDGWMRVGEKADYYLGTGGEVLLAPIAPLLLCIATGIVAVTWWILRLLMWPIALIARRFTKKSSGEPGRVSVYVSISIICILIFLILPWQIAFLGCWIIHLYTCAASQVKIDDDGTESSSSGDPEGPPAYTKPMTNDEHNHNMLVLLWMTWLLPLVAPVLVVWVRTLMTAGLTAHFDGDHNPAHVISFVILVELLSSRRLKAVSNKYVDHDLVHLLERP